nr:(d)CMP kinase [uncultured Mogibacterium sp.]
MIRIAIDGPGGAGKSTIAKLVGNKLGLEYIDTGAMYRAIGLKLDREGIKPDDIISIRNMLEETAIDFVNGRIILDGVDVSDVIRTQEISKLASIYSQVPEVRSKLIDIQRRIAAGKGVIMDGRDIGTNVLTDAELKIFLTADPMVRARRRYDELKAKGVKTILDDIYEEIKDRDYQDMNRKLNPLVQAEDAAMVDTSDMTIDEVVNTIVSMATRVSCRE